MQAFLPLFADPTIVVITALVIGLAIGSFLNVVIHRLPQMMERDWRAQCEELNATDAGSVSASNSAPAVASAVATHATASTSPAPRYNLVVPRSACPSCGATLRGRDNIPIFSWLLLGGKCAACKAPISVRYPIVEAVIGTTWAYTAWHFGPGWAAWAAMLFVAVMVALAFIDFDTQYLPDSLTLPLLWAGLLINLGGTFVPLKEAVIGAAAGYFSLWSVYWLFKLATGKEGMGYGDFKLLAAIGAWLGWKVLPAVILGSSLVGAVIGIGLIVLAKRGKEVPMPFGPYLVIAGLIALFWGPRIIDYYLGIF